jgi:hypothetical protein
MVYKIPICKISRTKWAGDVTQVVEQLLCKHEALSSNSSPIIEEREKEREGGRGGRKKEKEKDRGRREGRERGKEGREGRTKEKKTEP